MTERPYSDHLRQSARGMITAWPRMRKERDDMARGAAALIRCAILFAAPFLVFLAPLVALLSRASDRRDAIALARLRDELRAHRRIWTWGPNDNRTGNGKL